MRLFTPTRSGAASGFHLGARLAAKERRRFALGETAWHFDIDLGTVIERRKRPPSRIVAGDRIAEPKFRDVNAGVDRRRRRGRGVLTANRDEPVLRMLPGHGRHVGRARRAYFKEICPPVGVDDEVGQKVRPRRLHQDVDALGGARAAFGVADDPAHRVAGGDRWRNAGLHVNLAVQRTP